MFFDVTKKKKEFICLDDEINHNLAARNKQKPEAKSEIIPCFFNHQPKESEEAQRLEAGGVFVSNFRVNGILAVSRAFGDTMFDKQLGVISTPHVYRFTLDLAEYESSYLLLASDGVKFLSVHSKFLIFFFFSYS